MTKCGGRRRAATGMWFALRRGCGDGVLPLFLRDTQRRDHAHVVSNRPGEPAVIPGGEPRGLPSPAKPAASLKDIAGGTLVAKATQQSSHARNTLRPRRRITARATPHPSMTGNAASHAQNQIHPHAPIESMIGRPNVNPPATNAATPPAKQGNLLRVPVASISAPESKVTAARKGVMLARMWRFSRSRPGRGFDRRVGS
jgi:hypothetical protein